MRRRFSRNLCIKCKHRFENTKCKAFPNRIPKEILGGLIRHEIVIEGQVGDYVYEIKEEFKEIEKKIQIEDKRLIQLYSQNKDVLAQKIISEIEKAGFKIEEFERIEFFGKRTSADNYTLGLTVLPSKSYPYPIIDFKLFFPGSEICNYFEKIDRAEKAKGLQTNVTKLYIKPDRTYEYV